MMCLVFTCTEIPCEAKNCTVFSERELTFAICHRPSVCRLSSVCRLQRSCTLLRQLKFSAMFLRHLVPWPPIDIRGKFYGDRPRGTPPSGKLNTRGVAEYSNFGHIERYISETVQDRSYVITNRKSHMSFRLVTNSVTLDDLERRNSPNGRLICRIR